MRAKIGGAHDRAVLERFSWRKSQYNPDTLDGSPGEGDPGIRVDGFHKEVSVLRPAGNLSRRAARKSDRPVAAPHTSGERRSRSVSPTPANTTHQNVQAKHNGLL